MLVFEDREGVVYVDVERYMSSLSQASTYALRGKIGMVVGAGIGCDISEVVFMVKVCCRGICRSKKCFRRAKQTELKFKTQM